MLENKIHFGLVTAIPGLDFQSQESGTEKFVIPGSRFGIRLTDWSLFSYPQLTYFMHRAPTKGISEL